MAGLSAGDEGKWGEGAGEGDPVGVADEEDLVEEACGGERVECIEEEGATAEREELLGRGGAESLA